MSYQALDHAFAESCREQRRPRHTERGRCSEGGMPQGQQGEGGQDAADSTPESVYIEGD